MPHTTTITTRTSPQAAHIIHSALVRSNIRKYGGYLTVEQPLPCPFAFQIVDMKVLDPNELLESTVNYNDYAAKDTLYVNQQELDAKSEDLAQAVIFGRTEKGNSICVRVPYRPYLFLYSPGVEWTSTHCKLIHKFLARVLGLSLEDIDIQPQMRKRLDGWVPDANDVTKTEQISVLRVAVPNKKMFDKAVDIVDPIKAFEKIIRGTMKKIKEDISTMENYKYLSTYMTTKFTKQLNGIESRLGYIKRAINVARRDPDDLSNDEVNPTRLPQQFQCQMPPDYTFKSKELKQIWETWKEKYRLIHQNIEWWKQTGYKIKGFRCTLYPNMWETNVDHITKFCDQTRIVPSGWVEMNHYTRPTGFISHCQIECMTNTAQIRAIERHSIAPLLMASVDGEMYSSKASSFPNPLRSNNYVITIGVVLCRTNSTDMERFVFCLRSVDKTQITDATVFQFDDEQEMLKQWRDFMVTEADPDFVTGYNILGFDWKYFAHRAAQTYTNPEVIKKLQEEDGSDDDGDETGGEDEPTTKKVKKKQPATDADNDEDGNFATAVEDSSKTHIVGPLSPHEDKNATISRFFRLSRLWGEVTPCVPKCFKSNAYGERWSYHFHMTGRATQDLLIYIRREHKLESYKLDSVSSHFLKDNKIDLDHKLLFKYFETGPRERGLIAEYCIKDCVLPIQLCKHAKLMVLPNLVEMSRVTYTPLPQLINGGQQIKVFNQLVWYTHLGGFVMNDQPLRLVDGYEGATVLDPSPGWYNCPITVLDFASLYPSLCINKNLCYSTIVRESKYMNLPGVKYNVIQVGDHEHVFVQSCVQKGVLPTLEEHLLAARRSVKKQMKSEQDKDIYAMLDAKQLAIKVSCNSVYGFTGAAGGMYPEPAIAESITATGRNYIDGSKQYVLKNFKNSQVLYGDTDSIFIKFDVPATVEGLQQSFVLGREAAASISKLFGEAMSLEMEKVYFPFLLYGKKKRYIGLKYEDPDKYKCLDTKGIEIVRRDWSPLIRTIYKKCIDKVFFDRDIQGSKKLLQDYCQDMIDNKLDPNWFVMSKELKSKYANPESQVHVSVVKKISDRHPGSEPQVGDRVPYVIIRTTKKTKKVAEKSEDPEYAKIHKLPIDYEYYLDKQLERPLTAFFDMFINTKTLFSDVRRQLHNEYAGIGRGGLMDYLKPTVKDIGAKTDINMDTDTALNPGTTASPIPLLLSSPLSPPSHPPPPQSLPSPTEDDNDIEAMLQRTRPNAKKRPAHTHTVKRTGSSKKSNSSKQTSQASLLEFMY